MKKYLILALTMVLVISMFAGCGQSSAPSTPASAPESSEKAPEPAKPDEPVQSSSGKIRIGLDMPARDQYFSGVQKQIELAVQKYDNVEIVATYEADYDVQKQLEQMTTLATLNVDVIIAGIVDTNNAEAVIDKANGIPLVLVSRHPETTVLEKYKNLAFVGSPEKNAGTIQGEWLANYFKSKDIKTANYVLFMGPLGLENAMLRTAGAKDALTDNGIEIVKVFEDTAQWDRAEAMSKMQQILSTANQINCVICNNDEMALGAIEALKAANRLDGVPVVGVDATTAGMTAVKNGEMAMTVLQNAVGQAQGCVDAAVKMANGETVPLEIWIPFEPVTPENVDEYLASLAY